LGCGYPRPDSWGVLILCRHTSIMPVVWSASRARQQTPVFSHEDKYYQANTSKQIRVPRGEKPPSLLQRVKRRVSSFIGYQETKPYWMLEVLGILEKVAANKDNCSNHQDAKKLLDAVVQPITDDLHDLDHSARSSIVKASLRAIRKLLQTAPLDVGTTLRREISSKEEVRSSMERILGDPLNGGWDDETRSDAWEILRTTTQATNHGELS